ncbi:helix-turn-helix transcriptional regulator [Rothia sp. AR01]|uniref:Helix-turn-helix transcriptional regulator n=1 Tax=Rothia santali TaxID=2949643 RepID=A0A9X2KI37_9MICC|nr:helix-turn-helix transcriptional regulator [Rothia santali]MCP3425813.1 helix-turn-helix transcriptional regulator [Rothia santali]
MTTALEVGLNVRAVLARKGWSQAKAAEAIGMSRVAFSHRINGKYPFNVKELADLARALGVSYSSLVTIPEEGKRDERAD